MYSLAKLADQGYRSNKDFAACYLFTAESGTQVALECLQAYGGNGYINEYECG